MREDPSRDRLCVLSIGDQPFAARAGGLTRYLASLQEALQREATDTRTTFVGDGRSPRTTSWTRSDRGSGWSLPLRLLTARRAAARVGRDAQLVDAHFALYSFLPIFTTRLRRLPLVVHFHGPWADEGREGRGDGGITVWAKRLIEGAVYRRARTVVVLSEAFGRIAVERYGVEPSRVVVIPPGVDLGRFVPGDRSCARHALGGASSSPRARFEGNRRVARGSSQSRPRDHAEQLAICNGRRHGPPLFSHR